MHYNVFIQLCNEKTVQLKNLQSNVEDELKKSEIRHVECLNSLKENFVSFISQVIEKQTYPFFQNLRETSNLLINPDIINTAISTLSEKMDSGFDISEVNNQLEIITQNLSYSDEQLGLKLQFGPGIFTSKITNEITAMTDAVNSFYEKSREAFQEKFERIYTLTSKNIEEISKKMDETTEKTDFLKLSKGTVTRSFLETEEVNSMELIKTGTDPKNERNLLALALKTGRIHVFDLDTKESIKKFYAHEGECIRLFFLRESNSLYSSGLDRKLSVWKVSEGYSLQTNIENPEGPFIDLCLIPEDKLLAMVGGKMLSISQYNLIKLAGLDLEECLCKVGYMNSVQIASRIVCGDAKGGLHYVDLVDHGEKLKQVYRTSPVHNGPIEQIHIIEKRDLVITVAKGDPRIIFHNAMNFQQIREYKHNFGIVGSFYDAVDEVIFLNGGAKEVALFNLQSEKVENSFESSEFMGNYIWAHSKRVLACSLRDENKSFLYLRYFE